MKAFTYAANDGLMKYGQEFGPINIPRGMKAQTLVAIAQELLQQYEEEIMSSGQKPGV